MTYLSEVTTVQTAPWFVSTDFFDDAPVSGDSRHY